MLLIPDPRKSPGIISSDGSADAAVQADPGQDALWKHRLNLATLLLIIYAGAVQWPKRAPLAAAIAVVGLFLLAGLAVGTEGFIGSLRRVDLFHALLTPAYPLLAWLLLSLPGSAKNGRTEENPVKTL